MHDRALLLEQPLSCTLSIRRLVHEHIGGSGERDLGDRVPPSLLRWAHPVAGRSCPGSDSSVDPPDTLYAKIEHELKGVPDCWGQYRVVA